MKVKNLNNSSVKTKKLIKSTFAQLLQEKRELSKITVTELVERANINRGTFYLHYDSIYGVAEDFEEEILQTIILNDKALDLSNINAYFESIIAYLKENEDTYKMLLASNDPLLFLEKLSTIINEKIYYSLISSSLIHKSNSLKFDTSFFTDGIINQILKYFIGKSDYSLDDICKYMKKYFKILFLQNK